MVFKDKSLKDFHMDVDSADNFSFANLLQLVVSRLPFWKKIDHVTINPFLVQDDPDGSPNNISKDWKTDIVQINPPVISKAIFPF